MKSHSLPVREASKLIFVNNLKLAYLEQEACESPNPVKINNLTLICSGAKLGKFCLILALISTVYLKILNSNQKLLDYEQELLV